MGDYNWGQMAEEATVLLKGEFPVTVIKAEAKKTNDGSKDTISARLKINSGTYAGRLLFGNFTLSPESQQAMRMFFQNLNAFGLDSQFFASINGQPPSVIAQALEGRSAIATVEVDQWNGVDREKVTGYKPVLGGAGGAAFMPGLGALTGGGSSSPNFQPSPTTFGQPSNGGQQFGGTPTDVSTPPADAPVVEPSTTSTEAPGPEVQIPAMVEPSTSPPPVPSF